MFFEKKYIFKNFKMQNKHQKNAYQQKLQVLNRVFSGVSYKFSFWHNFRNNLIKIGPPPHFLSTFSAVFLKIAFFGIFEHMTPKKPDVRPRIDRKFFFRKKNYFKKCLKCKINTKNAYPTKKSFA